MVIQAPERNYTVIKELRYNHHSDIYLCTYSSNKKLYLIIRVKEKSMTEKLIDYFADYSKCKGFEDFEECFVTGGFFHIVFIYNKNETLISKLNNEYCNLGERLYIGERLTEKMVLLNMPCYLQVEALKEENLTISKSLDITFNYDLDIYNYGVYTIADVNKSLLDVFSKLFKEEIKLGNPPILKDFLSNLEEGNFCDYISIHKAYLYTKEFLQAYSLSGLEPSTIWFRLWEKIKNKFLKIKKIFAYAVLIIALIYTIQTLTRKKQVYEEAVIFEYIGTVSIENNMSGD